MNYQDTCAALLSLGWKEGHDQFRTYARMFYKRHDTPTRCADNADKSGMQIVLYVFEWEVSKKVSIEMELCGGLADGTWIKLENYCLPKDVNNVLTLIPRMLAMWEAANQKHELNLK